MSALLNPRDGGGSTDIIDVTAHSIRFFKNEQPKDIYDMFIPRTSSSIAEPIDVQIDEVGNDINQVYQLIRVIKDEKVPGLENILNYMVELSFSKDDPAINEHHCHITKTSTTKKHITYAIQVKPRHIMRKISCIRMIIITTKHNTHTNIYITQAKTFNNEHVLDLKKDYSFKNYISSSDKTSDCSC